MQGTALHMSIVAAFLVNALTLHWPAMEDMIASSAQQTNKGAVSFVKLWKFVSLTDSSTTA